MQPCSKPAKTRSWVNCVIGSSSTNCFYHHRNPQYKQKQTQQPGCSLCTKRHSPIPIQSAPNLVRLSHSYTPRFLDRHIDIYPTSRYQNSQLRSASTVTTTKANIQAHTMASDASYLSFLEKANQDPSAGSAQATQSKASGGFVSTKTVDQNVKEVPEVLKSVDVDYVSDTDEPFEAVVLEWEGAAREQWPSDGEIFFLSFYIASFLNGMMSFRFKPLIFLEILQINSGPSSLHLIHHQHSHEPKSPHSPRHRLIRRTNMPLSSALSVKRHRVWTDRMSRSRSIELKLEARG
jgi:hypothetical protein